MKQAELQLRDLLAAPFVFLMFLFARLALDIGGVFTAREILEVFGGSPKLPVKSRASTHKP